jgi:hypothetical protein
MEILYTSAGKTALVGQAFPALIICSKTVSLDATAWKKDLV